MATGVDVPKHIMDFIRLRTGVWSKQKAKSVSKKTSAVWIPVSAEHVQAKPVDKKQQVQVSADGTQTTIIPMD